MSERKKIGLITIYHVPNYGSVLQAYATQCAIENLGFECIILNYNYPNEWHTCQRHPRKSNLIKKGIIKVAKLLSLKAAYRKAKKLQQFRNNYYHFSKNYLNLDALKCENWNDYYAFVAGSDQIWNYRFTFADSAFMLSFVPDGKYRISLASSFSSNSIPDNLKQKYKTNLQKFDALSVRETNGRSIIENDLNIKKDVKVLLDPSLLLSKEDWLANFPIKRRKQADKYILLYLLTYAFEPRPYVYQVVRHFQEKYGYKIIAIEGYAPPKKALGLRMTNMTDAGIENYLDLLANAEIIITTSFHGTAFAANFGIPLVSIIPSNGGDDRQSSLLNQLNMKQCITPIDSDITKINPFYDTETSQKKLATLREDSLNWIRNSLQNL